AEEAKTKKKKKKRDNDGDSDSSDYTDAVLERLVPVPSVFYDDTVDCILCNKDAMVAAKLEEEQRFHLRIALGSISEKPKINKYCKKHRTLSRPEAEELKKEVEKQPDPIQREKAPLKKPKEERRVTANKDLKKALFVLLVSLLVCLLGAGMIYVYKNDPRLADLQDTAENEI
ncbi:hypothetical protein ENBRE01_3001, partial [Enteropsectra breve]